MKPIFEVRRLSFAYPGGKDLFQRTNMQLDRSVLTLLTGDNGSGKSTLLKLLCGEFKASSGEVLWNGESIDKSKDHIFKLLWHLDQESRRQRIGICPRHDLEIWQMALAQQAIDFPISDAAQRFMLDPVTLERPYHQISIGEAKATALMPLPYIMDRYWLLDEPLDSLAPSRARLLTNLCAQKLLGGSGMLVVTHNPEAYHGLPHRRLELVEGMIREPA